VVIYTKETSHTFDLRSGIETSSAYSRVTDYFQFIRLFVIIEKRGRIFSTRKTILEKYKQTPVYTRLPSFTKSSSGTSLLHVMWLLIDMF